MNEPEQLQPTERSSFGAGLLQGIGCAIIHVIVAALFVSGMLGKPLGAITGVSVLFIGVTQLVYMIPLIILASRRNEYSQRKGLITAAAVVFLLNASCWGWVATLKF